MLMSILEIRVGHTCRINIDLNMHVTCASCDQHTSKHTYLGATLSHTQSCINNKKQTANLNEK